MDTSRDIAADRLLDWMIDTYFRVEVSGWENIPDQGSGMLVANHSGAWALDGFVLHRILERGLARRVQIQASEIIFRFPVAGAVSRRAGMVGSDPTLGLSMLGSGQLVAVFPEGFSGVGKGFQYRYQLQRFSEGFAVTAMHVAAPVVPVAIIGAEEALPKVGEVPGLARLLDLPYVPVVPAFPLPSKWLIRFGEPMPAPARPDAFAERAEAARLFRDQVQETVQAMVDRERRRRVNAFW